MIVAVACAMMMMMRMIRDSENIIEFPSASRAAVNGNCGDDDDDDCVGGRRTTSPRTTVTGSSIYVVKQLSNLAVVAL